MLSDHPPCVPLFTYLRRKEKVPQWSKRCQGHISDGLYQNQHLCIKRTLNLDTGLAFLLHNVFGRTSSMEKIHTLRHQKAYSRAHVAVLFMCLEFEWESLGWIATHPNPLSNNVRCGGGINLFSVFMFFGNCDYFETKLYWSLSFETKSRLEKYQKVVP